MAVHDWIKYLRLSNDKLSTCAHFFDFLQNPLLYPNTWILILLLYLHWQVVMILQWHCCIKFRIAEVYMMTAYYSERRKKKELEKYKRRSIFLTTIIAPVTERGYLRGVDTYKIIYSLVICFLAVIISGITNGNFCTANNKMLLFSVTIKLILVKEKISHFYKNQVYHAFIYLSSITWICWRFSTQCMSFHL